MIAFASIALSMQAAPEEKNGKDTLFVQISAERLDVYPPQFVESVSQTSEKVTVKTKDGDEHIYLLDLIQSASTTPPDSLPRINSFKFNNKFNDQVFTDAQGEIIGDSLIKVTVGGIGKRLTPSFQLSDSLAAAFVNGIRQRSKVSRLRFEEPVTYLVARPGWQVLCGDESKMEWQPYGRSYRVDVTWLTDEVENFPSIDIEVEDGEMTVYVVPSDLHKAQEAIDALIPDCEYSVCAIKMLPQEYVKLTDEHDKEMWNRLLSLLDEVEDVQEVFHNVED